MRALGSRLPFILTVFLLLSFSKTEAQVTVEELLSSPFPGNLVGHTSLPLVAWVQNDQGTRNIWVAEGPDFEGRQLTHFEGDDGQEIGGLGFTTDGETLVFVRGGGANRQGEIPNPTSDPVGASQGIWAIPVSGGEPVHLADGNQPSIAPNDSGASEDRIAFLRRGQVWTVALHEDSTARQMFTIRGRAGDLQWSPDAERLAFVSNRGDHSFVGVFSVTENSVRYIQPSVDRDQSPMWFPDGERIGFVRIPNRRSILPFMPVREALPWSIWVADIRSGEGHMIWRADEGPGSAFRGVAAGGQLNWGAGDRLIFPWEKTGWTLLYSVQASGGPATLLTPGEFEVEHMTLTPDHREIVYSSNQDDIDRRHLWRVPVGGGRVEAVTSGSGIEWNPVSLQNGTVAFLASDAKIPAHATVLEPTGRRTALTPGALNDFPSDQLVEPEQIVFSGADGMQIRGQLFLPADLRRGERRPAVLFFHGGSRRQMLLGWHYLGYYHNAYAMNQYLASRGYIVLSVNYRSGIGYGLNFREAINYGARGASEFNDVLGAGLYLQSRSDVDPDRIGLWGGSYGGYLTALGLARASDLFAAGVDFHGVHDWNVVIRNFAGDYDPTARAEHARLAFESSPMADIDTWRSPVLLIHGDDDRNVPFSESVDLAESLRNQGVYFEQLIFPDEVHGFLLHRNWLAAYSATADFFDRKLWGRERANGGN